MTPLGDTNPYYHRFPGEISHQASRGWGQKVGPDDANRQHRRPRTEDKWYLDKVVLTINGECHYLWRAVDQDDNPQSSYGPISQHFRPRRHLLSASEYREAMQNRFGS